MAVNIKPIGKYSNDSGEEGIRYAWEVDGKNDYYVESGAFLRRTKLGKGTDDEEIRAYTTSVSLGCVLSTTKKQCKFYVTGNSIPYYRLLNSEEIIAQNIYMVLDDDEKNLKKLREFAYMGQGEPGFSYETVKEAIIGTDKIVTALGSKVYRHIFATSGVPSAILQLASDYKEGVFNNAEILLHLSVHSFKYRDQIMPINQTFKLEDVLEASKKYAKASNKKTVVNFLLFKDAYLSGIGPITNISKEEANILVKMLDPKYHRVILCEYNPSESVGTNGVINPEDVNIFEQIIKKAGFETKKFISFGREDKLACGLLGGKALSNLPSKISEEKMKRVEELIKTNF